MNCQFWCRTRMLVRIRGREVEKGMRESVSCSKRGEPLRLFRCYIGEPRSGHAHNSCKNGRAERCVKRNIEAMLSVGWEEREDTRKYEGGAKTRSERPVRRMRQRALREQQLC